MNDKIDFNSNQQNPPCLIILIGPNGAGKTTFYKKILKDDPVLHSAEFINCDNEAKRIADQKKWQEVLYLARLLKIKEAFHIAKINSNPSSPNIQIIAAKNTLKKIQNFIHKKQNFIYETTGSGKSHLNIAKKAKDNGYSIVTIFIGLSSSKLSQARVHQRVIEGGHSVPLEDIERRYPKILINLPDLLKFSNLSIVFDNSSKDPYKPIFMMDNHQVMLFDKYPLWLQKVFSKKNTNKEKIHFSTKKFASYSREKQLEIARDIMLARVTNDK